MSYKLQANIVKASRAKSFDAALGEWRRVLNYTVKLESKLDCFCGREITQGIPYYNPNTNTYIFIGTGCYKKYFQVEDDIHRGDRNNNETESKKGEYTEINIQQHSDNIKELLCQQYLSLLNNNNLDELCTTEQEIIQWIGLGMEFLMDIRNMYSTVIQNRREEAQRAAEKMRRAIEAQIRHAIEARVRRAAEQARRAAEQARRAAEQVARAAEQAKREKERQVRQLEEDERLKEKERFDHIKAEEALKQANLKLKQNNAKQAAPSKPPSPPAPMTQEDHISFYKNKIQTALSTNRRGDLDSIKSSLTSQLIAGKDYLKSLLDEVNKELEKYKK